MDVDLLERDAALAALNEARDAAASGDGRVVFVTGEPGIGKTSLVTRFLGDLRGGERVLLGTCDDLAIPRPLGPFRDLAGNVSSALTAALSSGAQPHEIQTLLLAELALPPSPTVLVLEDLHWADDATCDSIVVLGRRIRSLPALLVLTFRGGEAPPGHRLHVTVGSIRPNDAVVVELAPLSERAVASLAGEDVEEVYAATGGNPFFVTELLASRTTAKLPPSVANAVVARTHRLDEASRRVVQLVSVVPTRVSASLLDQVMPGWAAAAEEPERRQLLEVDASHVRFRHELARNAVRSSIPIARRRRLHAEILEALLAANADPADIVHHAEAAGNKDVVARFARVAAQRAAALESNHEAYAHYRRASDFVHLLPPAEQAALLEELAATAYVVAKLEDAFPAILRAIRIHQSLGDDDAVGRCTRVLSRLHWFAGHGDLARARAVEAVAILEPLGESAELGRAYSGVSQLAMLAEDPEQATAWGARALELATRLGDESTRAHALVNLGCARVQLDPADTAALLEAHEVADELGEREDATRALGNLAYVLMSWAQPELALRYARDALAYAQEYEVHGYVSYITTLLAWLRLRAGDWEEAEGVTKGEIARGVTVVQLLARTVLAELAVRRGDEDAAERLAEIARAAERAAEPQRVAPILELAAEHALTSDTAMPTDRLARFVDELCGRGAFPGRFGIRAAAWAAVAGLDVELDERSAGPYAAMARRDWRAAADAFGALGWPYDRALMLALRDDEESLSEAVEIARTLGARPLATFVTRRMRKLRIRVPAGRRDTTRANPAGLTARQLEVLGLLIDGLTNAEIADKLVVSPRTAEHHVAAVLTKLDAATRQEAAQRASKLGLRAHAR